MNATRAARHALCFRRESENQKLQGKGEDSVAQTPLAAGSCGGCRCRPWRLGAGHRNGSQADAKVLGRGNKGSPTEVSSSLFPSFIFLFLRWSNLHHAGRVGRGQRPGVDMTMWKLCDALAKPCKLHAHSIHRPSLTRIFFRTGFQLPSTSLPCLRIRESQSTFGRSSGRQRDAAATKGSSRKRQQEAQHRSGELVEDSMLPACLLRSSLGPGRARLGVSMTITRSCRNLSGFKLCPWPAFRHFHETLNFALRVTGVDASGAPRWTV